MITPKQLYEGNFLQESFARLQKPREREDSTLLVTRIEGPEVIEQSLLECFLGINYLFATGLRSDGRLMMGEIGGVVAEVDRGGKRVLAHASASMGKVLDVMAKIKEFDKTGDRKTLTEAESIIEYELREEEGVTIIDGNRNFAHYDFRTKVKPQNPLDCVSPDTYTLLQADGMNVMTNRHLRGECYFFVIPKNLDVTRLLDGKNETKQGVDLLRSNRGLLVPGGFVAGFHVRYDGRNASISPIVPSRDEQEILEWIKDYGLKTKRSRIEYLGASDPHGRVQVWRNFLE